MSAWNESTEPSEELGEFKAEMTEIIYRHPDMSILILVLNTHPVERMVFGNMCPACGLQTLQGLFSLGKIMHVSDMHNDEVLTDERKN